MSKIANLFRRWWNGEFTGLSLRPDLTDDQSDKFINDAKWAYFDACVDVGHAMSEATREFARSARPHGGSLMESGMGQLPKLDASDLAFHRFSFPTPTKDGASIQEVGFGVQSSGRPS
jgi:hypothetical protein